MAPYLLASSSPVALAELLGALGVGILCGVIVLGFALAHDRLTLGLLGFVGCVAAGWFLGLLLAIPVAAVFVWLARRPVARPNARHNALEGRARQSPPIYGVDPTDGGSRTS